MATQSWWDRMLSWVKRQYSVQRPSNSLVHGSPSNPGRYEAAKIVPYEKDKILRVTKDGLEYVDDHGNKCAIDFRACQENVEREVHSAGWVRIRDSEDVYVGFRDFGAKPPHITLATNPPTRFEFPMPGNPVLVAGGTLLRHDPEEFRDFREFQRRLMEAGVKTLDVA